MKIGVVFPQTELAGVPGAARELAVASEDLGYDHIVAYDHPVVADPAARTPPLEGPYDDRDSFHDPFVLFAHLAGVTSSIRFASGVLILPQRQTALVARQAADLALLSDGRFRLAVGTGWNHVEYDVLGVDFATRGARLDEQVSLLRRFWSEPLVTHHGRFDHVERAAINPRPHEAIPIWMGGFGPRSFRRAARMGDGFCFVGDVDTAIEGMEQVRSYLTEEGRSPDGFGFELNPVRAKDPDELAGAAADWQAAGGTHLVVLTMKRRLGSTSEHVAYLAEARRALAARLDG